MQRDLISEVIEKNVVPTNNTKTYVRYFVKEIMNFTMRLKRKLRESAKSKHQNFFWIDDSICLRRKMNAYECGTHEEREIE